jgi:hypothetical protein
MPIQEVWASPCEWTLIALEIHLSVNVLTFIILHLTLTSPNPHPTPGRTSAWSLLGDLRTLRRDLGAQLLTFFHQLFFWDLLSLAPQLWHHDTAAVFAGDIGDYLWVLCVDTLAPAQCFSAQRFRFYWISLSLSSFIFPLTLPRLALNCYPPTSTSQKLESQMCAASLVFSNPWGADAVWLPSIFLRFLITPSLVL